MSFASQAAVGCTVNNRCLAQKVSNSVNIRSKRTTQYPHVSNSFPSSSFNQGSSFAAVSQGECVLSHRGRGCLAGPSGKHTNAVTASDTEFERPSSPTESRGVRNQKEGHKEKRDNRYKEEFLLDGNVNKSVSIVTDATSKVQRPRQVSARSHARLNSRARRSTSKVRSPGVGGGRGAGNGGGGDRSRPSESAADRAIRRQEMEELVDRLVDAWQEQGEEEGTSVAKVLSGGGLEEPKRLTKLLSGLARRRVPHLALAALDWANNNSHQHQACKPNVFHYSCVVGCLAHCGEWSEAESRLEEMWSTPGAHPSTVTYNALLHACAKRQTRDEGSLDRARSLFSEMQSRGVAADTQTINSLLLVLTRANLAEEALQTFETMRARWRVTPDNFTYSMLLSACLQGEDEDEDVVEDEESVDAELRDEEAEVGKKKSRSGGGLGWERGWALYSDMLARDITPDVVTFNSLISLCARGRRLHEADQILSQMRVFGVSPSVVTLNALLHCCARCQAPERARTLFVHLTSTTPLGGVTPNTVTYNTLISVHEKSGDWEEALRLFWEMRASKVPMDTFTFSTLISACGRGRNWPGAVAAYGEMRVAGVAPTAVTFCALISACVRGGHPHRAHEIYQEMSSRGVKPNTPLLNSLLNSFAISSHPGATAEALALFHQMTAPQMSRRVTPDVGTYNAAISSCREGRQGGQALSLLRQMSDRDALTPTAQTYTCLFSVLEETGEWELVLSLFREMQSSDVEIDSIAYSATVSCLASCSRLLEALAVHAAVPARLHCTPAFNALLREAVHEAAMLGHDRRWKPVLRLLREMCASESSPMDQATLSTLKTICDNAPPSVMSEILQLAQEEILPEEACQVFDSWQRSTAGNGQTAWSRRDSWSLQGFFRGGANNSIQSRDMEEPADIYNYEYDNTHRERRTIPPLGPVLSLAEEDYRSEHNECFPSATAHLFSNGDLSRPPHWEQSSD